MTSQLMPGAEASARVDVGTSVEIVVTGLGILTSAGCGREPLAALFAQGETAASRPAWSREHHVAHGAATAALVDPSSYAEWLTPKAARRMCPGSKLAVSAARMALAEAGLDDNDLRDTAVVLGTAYGSSTFSRRLLKQILDDSPMAASPMLFTESVANAPAAQVALSLGARGPNVTVTQRQASALIAVSKGVDLLRARAASFVLVGSVDEIDPLSHAMLDRFRALSRSEMARPFDLRRDGFIAGEGATILVIERKETASERRVPAIARLAFAAAAFDPSAPAHSWGSDPEALYRRLIRELERREWCAERSDRVVSGACGSLAGDRLEGRLLKRIFGRREIAPVLAPKAAVGEHGGALLAAALLCLEGRFFGQTPGFSEVDPEIGVIPHDGRQLPAAHQVLISALAAGGAAAWLGLEAP